MITVIFFASLKDMAGREKIEIYVTECIDIEHLIKKLGVQFDSISTLIKEKKVMVTVNQEIADLNTVIKDGDEVAIMPPFSGGRNQ